VLDLARHNQDWVREQWADQWLGFEEDDLRRWMGDAGLSVELTQRLAGTTPELAVVLAVATKA
jgi:ArsR family transcriptional regulator